MVTRIIIIRVVLEVAGLFATKVFGNQPMMLFSVSLGRITNATLSLEA